MGLVAALEAQMLEGSERGSMLVDADLLRRRGAAVETGRLSEPALSLV
jgi:hypothetical protein